MIGKAQLCSQDEDDRKERATKRRGLDSGINIPFLTSMN